MADAKISALTGASTPVAGTEVLPIVQSGSTRKVSIANLTVGRTVSALGFSAFGTSGATTIIAEGSTNDTAYGRFEMRGRPGGAGQSSGYIVVASTAGGQAATNVAGIDFGQQSASGNGHFIAFATHNGTSLGNRVRISDVGFLGVATDSPVYQLDVRTSLTGTAAGDNTAIQLASQASGRDVNIRFGDNVNATGRIGYLSGAMYVFVNGASRLRAELNGDVNVLTGNLVIGTSGKGIDFSATPGTGTSELLDDYEEGTWTPTLSAEVPGDLSVTYGVRLGTYTKVGRLVTASCRITTSAFTHTTAADDAQIQGLPFTARSLTNMRTVGSLALFGANKAGFTQVNCQVETGSSSASFIATGVAGGSFSSVKITEMATGGTPFVSLTVVYETDS